MRILGIDPGLQTTGFGVIETDGPRLHYVASGTIKTREAAQGDLLLVRDDGDIVPSGNTVLRTGDRMLLFGLRDLVVDARERLVTIA